MWGVEWVYGGDQVVVGVVVVYQWVVQVGGGIVQLQVVDLFVVCGDGDVVVLLVVYVVFDDVYQMVVVVFEVLEVVVVVFDVFDWQVLFLWQLGYVGCGSVVEVVVQVVFELYDLLVLLLLQVCVIDEVQDCYVGVVVVWQFGEEGYLVWVGQLGVVIWGQCQCDVGWGLLVEVVGVLVLCVV